jgi:hypothetical protein
MASSRSHRCLRCEQLCLRCLGCTLGLLPLLPLLHPPREHFPTESQAHFPFVCWCSPLTVTAAEQGERGERMCLGFGPRLVEEP